MFKIRLLSLILASIFSITSTYGQENLIEEERFVEDVSMSERAKLNYLEFKRERKSNLEVESRSHTRYRNEEDKERFQQQFRIKFKYNIENSSWEILGLIRTGESFNSSHDTFYDFEDEENPLDYDPEINLTHFYLRNKSLANGKIGLEFGGIPTEKGIKRVTALDSGGFVDGARLKFNTKYGEVTVVGGYLGGDDTPNIFDRDRDLNYFELQVSKSFLDKLGAEKIEIEGRYINYEDENYYAQAIRARYKAFSNRVITIVQESIFDQDQNFKHGIGLEADLFNLINGIDPHPLGVKIAIRHQYMSEGMGDYGHLTSGFYDVDDHSLVLELKKRFEVGDSEFTYIEAGYRGRVGAFGNDNEYRHELFISISHKF